MGQLFKSNWKRVTGVRAKTPINVDEVPRIRDILGDSALTETEGTLANNQVGAANVNGLAFDNTVRAFEALVAVEIDATADLYELFTLQGIRTASGWTLASSSIGDDTGVDFTITAAGQVQYTSGNQVGFVSSAIKFRATTIAA